MQSRAAVGASSLLACRDLSMNSINGSFPGSFKGLRNLTNL